MMGCLCINGNVNLKRLYFTGYWVEGAGSESPPEFSSLSASCNTGTMPKPKIDQDETALAYRKYFYGKVSFRFPAIIVFMSNYVHLKSTVT